MTVSNTDMAVSDTELYGAFPEKTQDYIRCVSLTLDNFKEVYVEGPCAGGPKIYPESEAETVFLILYDWIYKSNPELFAKINRPGFKVHISRNLKPRDDYFIENTLDKYREYLLFGSDMLDHRDKTPLDILCRCQKENVRDFSYHPAISSLFTCDGKDLSSELENLQKDFEVKEDILCIRENVLADLPIDVQNLFKKAYQMFKCCDLIIKTEYLAPLYLVLAVQDYDNMESINFKSHKEIMMERLDHSSIYGALLRIRAKLGDYHSSEKPFNVKSDMEGFVKCFGPYLPPTNDGPITVGTVISKALKNIRPALHLISGEEKDLESGRFDNFDEIVESNYKKQYEIKMRGYLEEFDKYLPRYTYQFLETAAKVRSLIIKQMNERDFDSEFINQDADVDALALLLSAFHFDAIKRDKDQCTIIPRFFEANGIKYMNITERLGLNIHGGLINDTPLNKDIMVTRFMRYVKCGHNNGLNIAFVTPRSICANLCGKEFTNSPIIEKLFNELARDNQVVGDFYDQMIRQLDRIEKESVGHYKEVLDTYNRSDGNSSILTNAVAVYEYINEKEREEIDKSQMVDLSVLLSLLLTNYGHFFAKNGITLDIVCKKFGIDKDDLCDRFDSEKDKKRDYESYLDLFEKYLVDKNDSKSYSDLAVKEKLFSGEPSFVDTLIERIQGEGITIDKATLKVEVLNDNDFICTLPVEKRIEMLNSHEVEKLEIDENGRIKSIGTELPEHSKSINNFLPALAAQSTRESAIKKVGEIIQDIKDKSTVKKPTLLSKLSLKRKSLKSASIEPSESIKNRELQQSLKTLDREIDSILAKLDEEADRYGSFLPYVLEYGNRCHTYYEECKKLYDKITKPNLEDGVSEVPEIGISTIPEDTTRTSLMDSVKTINKGGQLAVLSSMMKRFKTSEEIAISNYALTVSAITTHNTAKNILESARNDYIPFILQRLVIAQGQETEKKAFFISNCIMGMLGEELTSDFENAKEYIDRMNGVPGLTEFASICSERLQSLTSGEHIQIFEQTHLASGEGIIAPATPTGMRKLKSRNTRKGLFVRLQKGQEE